MLSVFLKSKLHRITVTEAELDYQGSITLDEDFMDAVGIRAFEKVLVANLANGERFETYALPGSRGSRVCCLNGATARKGAPGDKIIVFAFCLLEDAEIPKHKLKIVIFGENNEIIRKSME